MYIVYIYIYIYIYILDFVSVFLVIYFSEHACKQKNQ